jgi:hypothetical protein
MNMLVTVCRELTGLFIDDGSLALAILGVVLLAALVVSAMPSVPMAGGGVLLFWLPRRACGERVGGEPALTGWLVYGRRRYIPLSAGCDSGPLMTGACAGDGSGAGLRLSKTGICGAGFPRRVVGLRPDKPAPCAKPPRARPEVDAPTTQATANTAAKTRFITHSFLSCAAPIGLHLIIQQKATSSLLPGLNPSCGVPSEYGNGRQGLARTSKCCSSALN